MKNALLDITDINAAWGIWPIQSPGISSLEQFDQEYERLGIRKVWLSAVESILAPEPETKDETLFRRLTKYARFRPVKTVNPLLTNSKASLERAIAQYDIVAIKLFPNYHGYTLDIPAVDELLHLCNSHRLPVLIQMRVNDERNQPPCLQIAATPVDSVVELSLRHPKTVVVALSSYMGELKRLASGSDHLLADISFLDGIRVLELASRHFPVERLVFGTAANWLIPQASALKLAYSRLSEESLSAIAGGALHSRIHSHD